MLHIYLKSLPALLLQRFFPLSVVTTPCHYKYHVISFPVLKLDGCFLLLSSVGITTTVWPVCQMAQWNTNSFIN